MGNRLIFLYHRTRLSDGVTQEDRESARPETCVQAVRGAARQIPLPQTLSCDGERIPFSKVPIPHCRETLLAMEKVPVAQTDTGRRGENPKVSERTLVKELGKMTP